MKNRKLKDRSRSTILILQFLFIGVFLVIIGRLIQLQIIEYDTYNPISERNSLRLEQINPARGLIYDRNGNLLVENEPSFSINITPVSFDYETVPLLVELTGVADSLILERVEAARSFSRHRTSRLLTDVTFEVFSNIQENLWRLPGISHQVDGKRNYPAGVRLSHALGYLGEVTREEVQRSADYNPRDRIGRSGLERTYEQWLRGSRGTQYITVNAFGRPLGQYDEGRHDVVPEKGSTLYTTIDSELQLLAEKLMEGKTGGLVALDPRDGGILAIVSAPDYDNSRLAGRLDRDYWISLQTDSLTPLFNRAVATSQPPGSTLKPIMGLIGMDMGLITPETNIYCSGGYFRGRMYRCLRVHGNQNIAQAIETSCNTYFYRLMDLIVNRVGLNEWTRRMNSFGLGVSNNIDITSERRGLIPDSTYFDTAFGRRQWGLGDLINLGIGQGAMGASPLQMAVSTAVIANGGYKVRPHLVREIEDENEGRIRLDNDIVEVPWVKRHLENNSIQTGMRKAVTEGSGRFYSNLSEVEVLGKTGTAQNPHGQNHGWYISYAPRENPEIVIAVLLENAGYGSISAAPVAGLLYEQYFYGEIRRPHVKQMVLDFEPAPHNPN